MVLLIFYPNAVHANKAKKKNLTDVGKKYKALYFHGKTETQNP